MNDSKLDTPMLDFLLLLFKNKRFLISFNSVIAVLAIIIVFSLSLSFRSTAIIAVQNESSGAGLASMLSDYVPFSLGLGGGSETNKFMGMVRTRRVMDVIIQDFDLQERYEAKTMESTYKLVDQNIELYDREDGSFSMSYTIDEDPVMAYEIVMTLWAELQKIALELNKDAAVGYREYVQEAYLESAEKLRNSEIQFSGYQESSGIINLESQISATVNSLAELETSKIMNEIQLEYLKGTMNQDNSSIADKEIEIGIIDHKIKELKKSSETLFLPLDEFPQSSMEYLQKYRAVIVDTKIAEFMALQLEQAKIGEMKNSVNLYLLDPPSVPDYKIKPKRMSLLVMTMFFSGLASIMMLLLGEYYRKHKSHIQSRI